MVATWTGTEMLIFGGDTPAAGAAHTGYRYDPVIDDWTKMASVDTIGLDYALVHAWTGTEWVLWDTVGQVGRRYTPASDSWAPMSTVGAPLVRAASSYVWSGTELLVWGGNQGLTEGYRLDGARYNPATDSWAPIPATGAPERREGAPAVWTGTEMVVWGGSYLNVTNYLPLNTGGRYDPVTNSWAPMTTLGAPSARAGHVMVWDGNRVIVWGGGNGSINFDWGALYDPATDAWFPMSVDGAPSARISAKAVWTGSEMLVWGGAPGGGRYHPGTDSWLPMSTVGEPVSRTGHAMVWTGSQAIVWGGGNRGDGGRYDAAGDSWTPIAAFGPVAAGDRMFAWTGTHLFQWGGSTAGTSGVLDTGALYDPLLDTVVPTSTIGAPSPRRLGTAVWSGSKVLVWGGQGGASPTNDGGAFDPVADTWTPISSSGAPAARTRHSAIWTGTEMVVWGGSTGTSTYVNSGGRYDPSSDAWTPLATTGAPTPRIQHSAVWTGSRMIVWGGSESGSLVNSGGIWDPATDAWTATRRTGAPNPMSAHGAVWTGTRMLVWGGSSIPGPAPLRAGGIYDPQTDAWQLMTTTGQPTFAVTPTSIFWTGTRMLTWPTDPSVGRYDPTTDVWSLGTTSGVPTRVSGTPVGWTGSQLIVWGKNSYSTDSSRYSAADEDSDLVSDSCDNCLGLANADQLDTDVDGLGNACDLDDDADGLADAADNCPLLANASQANADRDALGDACDACPLDAANDADTDGVCGNVDNCPSISNASQVDADADTLGDACDACPLDAANDADADAVCGNVDNCPTISNASQVDADADALGDACDACPLDAFNDIDHDGACGNIDNCSVFNEVQLDTDADTIGDLCDNCPSASNVSQTDGDGDGSGDACDCQPLDPNDSRPREVGTLGISRSGSSITLSWAAVGTADGYSVTRGDLATKGPSQYGPCQANGITATDWTDPQAPNPGQGWFYLVQAQNFDCGMGSLGTTSQEAERVNTSPGSCGGVVVTDTRATSESSVFGTVSGTFTATQSSNDTYESIAEVLSSGGSPSTRFSQLEHRWTVLIGAGSVRQLHVEGFRSSSTDGDDFRFEWSTNGTTWTPVTLASLPLSDNAIDLIGTLPSGATGSVTIRVVDTNRTAGTQALDTVTIDELFVRTTP